METAKCPAFVLDPAARHLHGESARLRAAGPAVLVELPEHVPAWVITRHELLQQLMVDPRVAKASRHWDAWRDGHVPAGWALEEYISVQSMTTADGAEHRRLRGLIAQALTPKRVAALRSRIEAITADLLKDLADHEPGPVDLVATYSYQLPMRVLGELFGIPADQRDRLRAITASLVSSTTTAEEVDRTKAELIALLAELVEHKRQQPGDDLTTALIEARDEQDRLSESELVGTLTIMIVAGHETTLDLLTNAVCALLTHPDQLALVQSGECTWEAVIEETLRWDSPLGHLPMRYAIEDIDIDGTVIRKGQAILASYVTVGRCPVYFGETAERFDVARAAKRHIMFGYGPHSCPGAHLARLEAEIALPALFAKYPHLALAAAPSELTPIPSIVNNCSKTLPVRLTE